MPSNKIRLERLIRKEDGKRSSKPNCDQVHLVVPETIKAAHERERERQKAGHLADIALGDARGGGRAATRDRAATVVGEERHPLVLPGKPVGGVHLLVAGPAERGLVRAAEHRRLGCLARVALYLHLPSSAEGILLLLLLGDISNKKRKEWIETKESLYYINLAKQTH